MNGLGIAQESKVREFSTWLEIDRDALLHNLRAIQNLALPGAAVLAVVKANAYGHGLREIAQCLESEVAYLGVATIDEALQLRRFEIQTPILLFGIHPKSAVEVALHAEIALSVSSTEQARDISSVARQMNKQAVIHVKVDTGMGRLGIQKEKAVSALEEIGALGALQLEGIFTHFAQGEDEQDPFTLGQIHAFYQILKQADAKGIHFAYRHAANSVGISNYREAHFNLVRPGLILYGLYPAEALRQKMNLKPVLSWKARIILIKKLKAGQSTGYSRMFQAKHDTTIAIIPVGYSHGYPFALSGKGSVLIRGKLCRIAGRVSMDYIALDLGSGDVPFSAGEVVTLLGRDGENEISGETLASQAGTIPYEILTRLDWGIPRVLSGSEK